MVFEIAVLKINPENAKAFEEMYERVVPVLRKQKGYKADKLVHAIERPEEYILMVTWEGVSFHQSFIDSPEYKLMAEPFGEFVLDSGFAHYNIVAES